MIGDTAVRRGVRGWEVLRGVLIVLWFVAAAAAWWMAPREVSYQQAAAEVSGQRVTAYEWGDSWNGRDAGPWFGSADLTSSGTRGPIFAWRTPHGQVHWADTTRFDEVHTTGSVDEADYSGPGAVGIAQSLRAAGLESRTAGLTPWGGLAGGIGLVLGLIFLTTLVAGPAPVLGTRWFWLWLVCLTPYGLGMIFWLVREHPWSRVAPGDPATRDRGYLGLLIGVVAAILITVLLIALDAALGDTWIPLRG